MAMADFYEVFDSFHFIEDIGNIEKGRFFKADIDECRLHAWQDPNHAAPVNVADDAEFTVAFDVKFGNVAALQKRNPRLVGRGVDDQFLGHGEVSLVLSVYIVKVKNRWRSSGRSDSPGVLTSPASNSRRITNLPVFPALSTESMFYICPS